MWLLCRAVATLRTEHEKVPITGTGINPSRAAPSTKVTETSICILDLSTLLMVCQLQMTPSC